MILRPSGEIKYERDWEQWSELSNRQLIRPAHPCRINATVFAIKILLLERPQANPVLPRSWHKFELMTLRKMTIPCQPIPVLSKSQQVSQHHRTAMHVQHVTQQVRFLNKWNPILKLAKMIKAPIISKHSQNGSRINCCWFTRIWDIPPMKG